MTDHDLGSGARETGTEDAGDERADDGHVGDEGTVPTVPAALRAGAALFNEGYVLAAHDPWEAAWLPLAEGPDERLLHGLIAAAAATHHAGARNWSGAVGCAGNAVEYLDGVGSMPRGSTSNPSATGVAGSRPTRRRSSAQPHRRSGSREPRSGSVISICRRRCSRRPRWPVRSLTATRRPSRPRRNWHAKSAGPVGRSLRSYCSRSSASPTPAHRWPRGSRITWNSYSESGGMSTTCFKRCPPGQAPSVGLSGSDGKLGSVGPSSRLTSPSSSVGSLPSPVTPDSVFGFPSNV